MSHSEAKFLNALAWVAHRSDPSLRVRLETSLGPGMRLDLQFSRPVLGTHRCVRGIRTLGLAPRRDQSPISISGVGAPVAGPTTHTSTLPEVVSACSTSRSGDRTLRTTLIPNLLVGWRSSAATLPTRIDRLPCDEALMTWALTLALILALGRELALCGTATPLMRRLG